jgi:hypothetical protein
VVPEIPFQSKTWSGGQDGIEQSTRGFSVRRRARFGATKPKNLDEFSRGRPNRPRRPSPCRTPQRQADELGPSRPSGDRTGGGFAGPAGESGGTGNLARLASVGNGNHLTASLPARGPNSRQFDHQREKPGDLAGLLTAITTADAQSVVLVDLAGLTAAAGITVTTFDLVMLLAVPLIVAVVLLRTALVATSKVADLVPCGTEILAATG